MIYSTDFGTDIGGWNQYGASTLSWIASVGRRGLGALAFQTFSDVWAGTYVDVGSVADGTLLLLKIRVKAGSTGAGQFVQAAIKEETDNETNYSVPVKLSADAWQEIWVTHKVTGTQHITVHVAGFDYSNGIFYVDDVELNTYVTPVMSVSGRTILKDGATMTLRGINYTNDAIGEIQSNSFATEYKQLRYDAEDIAAAGFNVVRTYMDNNLADGSAITTSQIRAGLDEFYRAGVYVFLNHWVLYDTDFSVATGGANRTSVISTFAANVLKFKDHPAVICFTIGNENNYHFAPTSATDFYSMIEAAISGAKPTCTRTLYTNVAGEISTVLTDGYTGVPSADIWALNVYRGQTLSNMRQQITPAITKPCILSEFGFDRYNTRIPAEDEYGQAYRDLGLIKEAEGMYPVLCGHFIFCWSDQWWKAAGSASAHDTGPNTASNDDRDGLDHEEYWGICDAVPSGNASPRPKKIAYNMLKERMTGHTYGQNNYRDSLYNLGLNRLALLNISKSLSFNGTTSLATTPLVPSMTGFSFAFWVKISRFTANDRLIDYGAGGPSGGFLVSVHTSAGYPRLIMQVYNAASPVASMFTPQMALDKWVHIAGTIKPNEMKFYCNGVLVDADFVGIMTDPVQTLTLGRRCTSGINFSSIALSRVVFKNGNVLTQAEISDLYLNGTVPAGASCYISCDNDVTDQTGNANSLTVTSTSYLTDTPVKQRSLA